MKKKGQDFLNLVEIFIFAGCILFSIFFLSAARVSNLDEANQNVADYQFAHKSTQALRTLAQTPVELNGEQLSFAQVANKYMADIDYLDTHQRTLSTTEINKLRTSISASQQVLQTTARSTILSVFSPQNGYTADLVLTLVILDTEQHQFNIGNFYDQNAQKHEEIANTFIQLPAYFTHTHQPPGSYYLKLSVQESKDNSPLPGFFQ